MKTRLVSMIALTTAVGAAACSQGATSPPSPAASRSTNDPAPPVASGTGSYGQSNSARIRLLAYLTPPASGTFGRASGKAKWDSRNNNTVRELEMEVEDMKAGTQVEYFVNGVKYGSTGTVDAFGRASINLSTQLGHTVPTAAAGLAAEVRAVGGVVVVSGLFPK